MSNKSNDNYPNPELLATFPKNSIEQVRVCLTWYEGNILIDVRCYYKDAEGYKPSKKGVAIRYSKLPALLQALEKARGVLTLSLSKD